MPGQLEVGVGFHSSQGKRPRNEDYAGVYLGTPGQRARFGVVGALADGVGGAKGGRIAAETAVRGFIDAYLALPETIGVRRAAARSLESVNRWIFEQGRADPLLEGMATTFTGLILRARRAHIVHVGDTRLYRLRGGQLRSLTRDHVVDRPDMSHILTRAVGTEESIRADYAVEVVQIDDRYLLCSDGTHGVLRDRQIVEILIASGGPDEAARRLVDAALAAGTQDNATALIVDIIGLPATEHAELEEALANLPILAPPKSGQIIDDYLLCETLADGNYTRVFRAVDQADGRVVVLKFPKPGMAEEPSLRSAFLRELWIPSRVRSPWIGETIDPVPDRRTRLYSIMPFYAGETLAQRIGRSPKPSFTEGSSIAIKLAKAVASLHRAGIIHRDLKPENVILQSDGGVKLIDLGVAHLPHLADFPSGERPGTPSYMAPELFDGHASDERTDLFALGVTIYRIFSGGAYPYGEIEPFSRPRFGRPVSLARLRPDLPVWLEPVLFRAIATTPDERFADVVELAFELENGLTRSPAIGRRRRSLYDRNPLLFWQAATLILAALLIAILALR
ncbi:MAG TPA: protein kinase [Alphaproteobacteria bacterium]|nr:protein kinase [Alphaproteobacteria bacterium]